MTARFAAFIPFIAVLAATLIVGDDAAAQADDAPAIGHETVADALDALRSDPSAQFEQRDGWTIVASRDHGDPVLWSFTPAGHPAHPAVIKRTALEQNGEGLIDLSALCHAPQDLCDALIAEFRQRDEEAAARARPAEVLLTVGVALNERDRLRVSRMLMEEGKAAEIRMDNLMKLVLVPSVDDFGGVTLWAATYGYDGRGFALLAEPALTSLGAGTTELEVAGRSGEMLRFSITPL